MSILVTEQDDIDINLRICSNPECVSPTSTRRMKRKNGTYTQHWYSNGSGGHLCEPCYKKMVRSSTMHYRKIKQQVFTHYFGPNFGCIDCGIKDIRVLTMDHENGGGNKHRLEIFGNARSCGMRFYEWLRTNKYPNINFAPRCANCHMIVESERTEAKYR